MYLLHHIHGPIHYTESVLQMWNAPFLYFTSKNETCWILFGVELLHQQTKDRKITAVEGHCHMSVGHSRDDGLGKTLCINRIRAQMRSKGIMLKFFLWYNNDDAADKIKVTTKTRFSLRQHLNAGWCYLTAIVCFNSDISNLNIAIALYIVRFISLP